MLSIASPNHPSKQELERTEEAWQLRWASESARLQRAAAEQLAAAATAHQGEAAEREAQHRGEAGRLRDAIASLELSERQLLKTRAVLEAQVEELAAALQGARREAADATEGVQLAVGTAVAAAHIELQAQVLWGGVGWMR